MYNLSVKNCNICPRQCKVNREAGELGWCRTDNQFYISSICIHKGEEPVISGGLGVCNVFFAHCNLQCVYCQNFQISDNKTLLFKIKMSFENVISQIENILKTGINRLGFVSPSHFVNQLIEIVLELNKRGYKPIIIYNSNGYDSVETLKILENIVDIYLPDFKYLDNYLAKLYSKAENYPEIAKKAIKEMYRQKGSTLIIDENNLAESGIIIRHLVLPNHLENSKKILKFIAEEISYKIHISLMSQFFPTHNCMFFDDINRKLTFDEYQEIIKEMEKLELYNGFVQELESSDNYKPNFENQKPFE